MRWNYVSLYGTGNLVTCTVCGDLIGDELHPDMLDSSCPDMCYSPWDLTDDQADWIRRIWKCDPYCDFNVCEECMEGHCGAVPGFTANGWLALQIERYRQRSGVEER